ncbi:HK97-gp10 family putative phage morphogenesis protein [Marinobacterium lutimaris]|uniref:Phage protein, HK97 gp10 family n=1 Tax=Marinobacterium lutimaris TaxID=568106 RepID=A0A1H5Y8S3_9GAMM|nr:HK97-gp10 family putative phage morphogenesis protein [Marinobacterium lutimaris]SEG20411.1 phage protein, HK97 gp10 family [Marinobacterium lutimaris]
MANKRLYVSGLDDLEKQLISLGAETGVKTLRSAGRKAMEPVQISAAIGAGEDSGDLRQAIVISSSKPRRGRSRAVDIHVGATKKSVTETAGDGSKSRRKLSHVIHAAIAQEYGTSKQQADPFLRPALLLNYDRVLVTFKAELAKAIKRAIKRQSRTKK